MIRGVSFIKSFICFTETITNNPWPASSPIIHHAVVSSGAAITPPKCPASLILSTMLVFVPSRTIFFSTNGLFPNAMAHFGQALVGFPGWTTFTTHSWQNVCRHSI